MVNFKPLALTLPVLYVVFNTYAWIADPWWVRYSSPPNPLEKLNGIFAVAFPHLMLGSFGFSSKSAFISMIYIGYLLGEISMQLYLDWFPYVFGLVSGGRWYQMMTEQGSSDHLLPKWPNHPFRPVPTTEATYRMAHLLIILVVSVLAVLNHPKLMRKHGYLMFMVSLGFGAILLLQFVRGGADDIALLYAPIFSLLISTLLLLKIVSMTPSKGLASSNKEPRPVKQKIE